MLRDEYQRLERNVLKLYKIVAILPLVVVVILYLLPLFTDDSKTIFDNYTLTYFFFALFGSFILQNYTYATLSMMISIFRFHRLEFWRHIRSMLILFIATELSLLFLLIQFTMGIYSILCVQH